MRRTEGWPAGLYLAALSLVDRTNPGEFVHHFSGNNRFIGDYLTEEVLARQTAEVRNFILDMSIVDRFSAPLCDYLTGRQSAGIRDLQHTNLFLIPLDAEDAGSVSITFGAVARSLLRRASGSSDVTTSPRRGVVERKWLRRRRRPPCDGCWQQ